MSNNPKLNKVKREKINEYLNRLLKKNRIINQNDFIEYFWFAFFKVFDKRRNDLREIITDCKKSFKQFEWKITDERMLVNQVFCAYKIDQNVDLLTDAVMRYDAVVNSFEGKGLDFRLDINFEENKFNILVEVTIPLEELIVNFKKKVLRTKLAGRIFERVR